MTIAIESRLRIGRAIAKTEEEVARHVMAQLKERGHPKTPPALATDCSGQLRGPARTPAMAAGLTDHIWTIRELLTTVVIPTTINTK